MTQTRDLSAQNTETNSRQLAANVELYARTFEWNARPCLQRRLIVAASRATDAAVNVQCSTAFRGGLIAKG